LPHSAESRVQFPYSTFNVADVVVYVVVIVVVVVAASPTLSIRVTEMSVVW
jgi:lipoprotein signal peptidase